jgi:hypothetical protein
MKSVLPQGKRTVLDRTSPDVHELVVRISSSESLEGLGHRFLFGPTLEQLVVFQPQPVVVLQEVLAMRLGIVQMRVHGIKKRGVLGVAVMLMFPHGLFSESFLLVLLE